MRKIRIPGTLVAMTLLAAPVPMLMMGCGGSSSSPSTPTPTPTAPTVVIGGVSTTAATGPVTVTFTFSQAMSTFPASAVTVTGGTPAASTTKVDTTHYTLVVTPPANASGTIAISVAAGAFSDAAGVASTVAASANQPYNTVVAVSSYPVIDFNTSLATGYAYAVTDFGGEGSSLVTTGVPTGIPAGGPQVVQTTKTSTANTWAGVTLSEGYLGSVGQVPFSSTATKMKVVFYATGSGQDVKLKVEDAMDGTKSVETDVLTTAAGWQTLTFDFSTPSTGSGLDSSVTYNKVSIFPDFGVTPAADETFYVGPVTFLGATAPAAAPLTTPSTSASYPVIDFNTSLASGLAYATTDFGNEGSVILTTGAPAGIPAGGPAVVQTTKPGGTAQTWAGVTLSEGYLDSIGTVPFSATNTKMTVVLYAPAIGKDIKLKVENAMDPTKTCEVDMPTTAVGWQTLTFDFSAPTTGTAPYDPTQTFNKISIFPDFNVVPSADEIYYVGPITFLGATAPSAPPLAPIVVAAPAAAAPVPTAPAANVVALYTSSNSYTTHDPDKWRADWSAGTETDYTITGTSTVVKEYQQLNYVGLEFLAPTPHTLNLTGMTTMHIDLWTPAATQFSVKLVGWGVSAEQAEFQVNLAAPTITQNAWVSLEIPLSDFTGVDLTSIGQILWVDNTPTVELGTFFLDNIYFHK